MKARAVDYRSVLNTITSEEWDSYTESEWCAWCDAWNSYVKVGGTRPHTRPPV